jgi:hypothetical protein
VRGAGERFSLKIAVAEFLEQFCSPANPVRASRDEFVLRGSSALKCIAHHFSDRLLAFPAKSVITSFDAPGAGRGAQQGTYPYGINNYDVVTGYYIDSNYVAHGFVLAQ